MNIQTKAVGIELTDAITAYIEEKIQSVEKFAVQHKMENLLAAVEVGKTTKHHQSGHIFFANVSLRVHGHHFRATSEKNDLYGAIDDMRDELVRELTSRKGRTITLVHKGARIIKDLLHFGRSNTN